MRHFTVLEFGKLEIGKDISSEEASAIQDVAGKVFTRYQSYLVAENYVGVIRSQHGLILEILPKIDLGLDFNQDDNSERTKQIFLRMLRCYRDLKRSLPQHDNNIRSLSKFPMLEIFIRLFLIDLQKLIHSGLAHRYVPIEENLPYLKGRLLFREQIRQNLVNASLLFVSHDTLSINRPANRLIRSTLNRLGRSIRGVENQLLHREMDLAFADVPESKNIRSDWKSHHIDRTMQLYHPIIKWVELFLFDQGLTAYSGKHRNISLLFPMERVFEDFVTHAFHRYQDQYRVKTQGPKKNLIEYEERKIFNMRPDLVLMKHGEIRFVLDAKWKRFDRRDADSINTIDQPDLYQIFAYSKRYKCENVMLIYPKNESFKEPANYRFFDGTSLICMPFDCVRPGESVKQAIECFRETV